MVKIHRIWFNTERMDREDHYKITLFSRPRVSIHVDEYIWSFIEENIVKPHKLMRSEKYGYLLDISFDQFDPAKHRYFPLSSYNGLLREGVEMDSANRSYFREDFAGGKDRTTEPTPPQESALKGNKRMSWRTWLGGSLFGISALIIFVLWRLSVRFPISGMTGNGVHLTGFSGFLGFHGILHESYVIVAIGIIGLILLITDFIRIKKNNR